MKYDVLYNFISPVTGQIASYLQLPDLPSGNVWLGDSNNRPTPSTITPVSSNLQKDYTFVGDNNNISQPSPALIDIRLDIIDIRHDIDSLVIPSYITQKSSSNLPNAQSLDILGGGILKSDTEGVISIAITDTDYMAGVSLSIPNTVVVFADEHGKKIKMGGRDTDPVLIDSSSNIIAEGLLVKPLVGTARTGFVAPPTLLIETVYKLPINGGLPTQVLATSGTVGANQLFWMTLPSTVTICDHPWDLDPRCWPLWIPVPDPVDPVSPPIPTPIPIPTITPTPPPPFAVPVFPTPGGGEVTTTPTTIDPTTGDIDTPGGVTAGGPVTTPEVVLTPTDTPTNTITIKPPSSVTAPYIITLPPTAGTEGQVLTQGANGDWVWTDPAVTDITIEPSTGITITGTPTDVIVGLDDSGVVPDSYFIPNIQVDRYGRIVEVSEPENQQLVDLVYGTLSNFPVLWGGFASNERDYPFKVKTSYYIPSGDFSSSSLLLFNRADNGYILKTKTQYGQNPDFFFEQELGNTVTDLYSYNGTTQKFAYFKPINMGNNIISGLPTPQNADEAANKAYVDAHQGSGTVTSITLGTGLSSPSGTSITTSGTINLANTSVSPATYRLLANTAINAQGQITSASNGSPTTTTNTAIAVWGNTTGTSLINTSITIDNAGNIAGSGSSTFLAPQISNADGVGSLNFLSGTKSLQMRLNGSLANNVLWFLPITNSSGFLQNNGSGTLSWGNPTAGAITLTGAVTGTGTGTINTTLTSITTSQISNFNSSVAAFRLDQFAAPTTSVSLGNQKITNLLTPASATDAATKGYVDNLIGDIRFITNKITTLNTNEDLILQPNGSGDISLTPNALGNIYLAPQAGNFTYIIGVVAYTLNSLNRAGLFIPSGDDLGIGGLSNGGGYLYVGTDHKLYFVNSTGSNYIAG